MSAAQKTGPLAGLRVVEMAGIGPGPFCGMLLADLGADVVVIDRAEAGAEEREMGPHTISRRGKRAIAADLKQAHGVATVLDLVEHADALIEGMRPGVMERLGLGPDVCLQRNPALAYGRITGWGQQGPLAQAAGHDINYIALSGALWWGGQPGQAPFTPPSVVGDVGGGSMYLAVGLLAAVMHARATGCGQVVDAAIVDGSAHMLSLLLGLQGGGLMPDARGTGVLDGPPWYNTYRCADGHYVSIGPVEPRFYRMLREKLGLAEEEPGRPSTQPTHWAYWRSRFAALFARRTRAQWCELLEGTDVCFAPVLTPNEAAEHPHMKARGVYSRKEGVLHPMPAPRFSVTPAGSPGLVPPRGGAGGEVLREWRGD